jgi:predicted glycosyltransferase
MSTKIITKTDKKLSVRVKALFMMNTPADVYTWMYPIKILLDEGNEVRILARNYSCTLDVLKELGFSFKSFHSIKSKYFKIFEIFTHVKGAYDLSSGFKPSIIVGFGVDAALTAGLLRKPCIVFLDNEPTPLLQYWLTKPFVNAILTPNCFLKNLGEKQVRFNSFKELAYLNPKRFTPDPSIYNELGINTEDKFVILRFNAFDAMHDIGRRGFSDDDKLKLFKELRKYAYVFISSEGNLIRELQAYKLTIHPSRIHHALYYSSLIVADTGTMPWEAAVLGTPAIVYGSFTRQFGNFIELEKQYGLNYSFTDFKLALGKAVEILNDVNLKIEWQNKRERLLADKVDAVDFIVDLIKKYSKSV